MQCKSSRQQGKECSSQQGTFGHSGGINLILMPECFNCILSLCKQLLHVIRARLIIVPVSGKTYRITTCCEGNISLVHRMGGGDICIS